MELQKLIEQLELLEELQDLRNYGLSEEEILGYLEWESDVPIKRQREPDAN